MTDMPETIWVTKDEDDVSAQILGDLYAQHFREGMTGEPVAYRRADLPPSREQVEAMVKPLEWVQPNPDKAKYISEPKLFFACGMSNPSGYRITRYAGLEFFTLYGPGHMGGMSDFPTLEEAKAAAQADYTRRILAALGYEGEA